MPPVLSCHRLTVLLMLVSWLVPWSALAATELPGFSVAGQFTQVLQWHPAFAAAYTGANSLRATADSNETTDLTLFLAAPVGRQAALYVDPEVDQGFGLSNTLGVAGFPSAEAFKVGNHTPRLRLPRLFVQVDIDLGGATEVLAAGVHQAITARAAERVTLTAGKLAVTDLFDANRYAHDARSDFLNWSVVDGGAFDYAADAFGFTYGVAAEWIHPGGAVRAGGFALSGVPNGTTIDSSLQQNQWVLEWEQVLDCNGQPGALRLLAFSNRARMARYQDAVQAAAGAGLPGAAMVGTPPDVAAVRAFARRNGVAFNLEQAFGAGLGLFVRLSANDGRYEAYEFTEINRSAALGLVAQGGAWQQAGQRAGIALVQNQLSAPAQRYFAVGGLGLLVGDGAQRYGPENLVEAWYAVGIAAGLQVTIDAQRIVHPAYNRDRGPVTVLGLRLHAEF